MVSFEELLAFDEVLDDVTQALEEAVAHLLPLPPDQQLTPSVAPQQVPLVQGHAQAAPPGLSYNSESEPDSDDEMDQDLPWRDVQDIPSFQLRNIMRYAPQQSDCIEHDILDIENSSDISLQNTTPPPNDNNARNEL